MRSYRVGRADVAGPVPARAAYRGGQERPQRGRCSDVGEQAGSTSTPCPSLWVRGVASGRERERGERQQPRIRPVRYQPGRRWPPKCRPNRRVCDTRACVSPHRKNEQVNRQAAPVGVISGGGFELPNRVFFSQVFPVDRRRGHWSERVILRLIWLRAVSIAGFTDLRRPQLQMIGAVRSPRGATKHTVITRAIEVNSSIERAPT